MHVTDRLSVLAAEHALAKDPPAKIGRDAFLYMAPRGDISNFAQCATCCLFMPAKERCAIHRPHTLVRPDSSCALYVHGAPNNNQPFKAGLSGKETGLVHAKVQCHRCEYGGSKCQLYVTLNKLAPEKFALEENIERHACCNAFTTAR